MTLQDISDKVEINELCTPCPRPSLFELTLDFTAFGGQRLSAELQEFFVQSLAAWPRANLANRFMPQHLYFPYLLSKFLQS
jgi:hypothetical protein